MQLVLFVYWFMGIAMCWFHIRNWNEYNRPEKDDYFVTGIFIFLSIVAIPLCLLLSVCNGLKT